MTTSKTSKAVKNVKSAKNSKTVKAVKNSKAIKSKSTRKSKPYSVKIDGKTLNCKTSCLDIGKDGFPIMTDDKVFEKKCKKCPVSVQEVCFGLKIQNTPKIVKKAGTKVQRPFDCAFDMWLCGSEKKSVVLAMQEKGMKEKAAARFVNDIFSVGNAAIGRARKKGGLIERYLNWAVYGIGEEPTGCKATLGFCKQYAPVFKTATV